MLTESSKPTIAKNASPVAAITPPSTERSPVSNSVTREKSPSPIAERPHADADHDQQAGQLDAGEHDVGLDALADAAVVDQRDQAS